MNRSHAQGLLGLINGRENCALDDTLPKAKSPRPWQRSRTSAGVRGSNLRPLLPTGRIHEKIDQDLDVGLRV